MSTSFVVPPSGGASPRALTDAQRTARLHPRVCRALWERVEREGVLPIEQIMRDSEQNRWTLGVRVPWQRYLCSIGDDDQYESLLAELHVYTLAQSAALEPPSAAMPLSFAGRAELPPPTQPLLF